MTKSATKKYVITKLAGKEVAGFPNPGAGKMIDLTAKQAEHPLRIGHIEVPKSATPKPKG